MNAPAVFLFPVQLRADMRGRLPAVCGDGYVTHSEACDPPEAAPGPLSYGDQPVTYCTDICQYVTVDPPVFDNSGCYAACTQDSDCAPGFTCQGGDTCVHPLCS